MGQNMRLRCWDKEKKVMTPSFPLYKACFTHYERTADMIIMLGMGLKDRNGKEIYEADIVSVLGAECNSCPEKNRCDTGAVDACPQYELSRDVVTMERFPKYWLKNESFGLEGEDLIDPKDCQVIGNIYENPELIG